ncbi:PREDICTED: dyslexia susceptibility 1 candidate gene 1 protein homolog [Dinoponera quadriceps]|uniref:Dyslexia susceptibility 1 candidate gene 1 protein homolog n=1 Tax=Dinoponera quadriceps TaxID=609295 RepID=A0A6P3YCL4_DINQU|nr:PREDICTED: dyslexia susceptibility 1 candidate gene 1 protein homolog [Dinoponera quadriceps]
MPTIIVKNHQWRQTERKIIIHVPLKAPPKNVDLFATDNYVKINSPPFILELFLWGNVREQESECVFTDNGATFSLQKANVGQDWPRLEIENLSKEQKLDFRRQILEKAQDLAENRAKFKREKRQYLQKEAVKTQINLDTRTLNKIEFLRDAHRKTAMQEFEDWRRDHEIPILQNISGKVQKNRKEYRPPLQWFKNDSGTVRFVEVNERAEAKEAINVVEKQRREPVVIGELEKKPIVEESMRKEVIAEQDLKVKSIAKGLSVGEGQIGESVDETNLKAERVSNQKKADIVEVNESTTSESFNFDGSSANSEDSESDHETAHKSPTRPLVEEMDQKSVQKFHAETKKQRPPQDVIDRVLRDRYSKTNQIFNEPSKIIPLPRKSGTINVTFSERAFPTPARESSHIEEQEWLSKQAEARRKTGFVVEDLRPEEQDPQWLKDKGDEFFKTGNYLAAINAYTHGIKISNKMTALYVNRSAAHYALGNYYRCIDDCSTVLELMEPKCESNRVSRARCHARRGAALCKLSAPQHGIPELEAALKLEPNNESIKRDLLAARRYFNIKE